MANTFFTSDTHFSHANIIKYCTRPFADVKEMNIALVDNWNAQVGPDDLVYHLGDVAWGSIDLNCLNGKKILIIGNHDKPSQLGPYFDEMHYYLELKKLLPKGRSVVLCHYPIESWNGKFHKAIHLHGHCHGTMNNTGLRRFDVGVDCFNYSPIPFDNILTMLPVRDAEAEDLKKSKLNGTERDAEFKHLNETADKDE